MIKYGFLFDVDGCITSKDSKDLHARLDDRLLPWFQLIKKSGLPIAFITGRAYPFMKETAPVLFREKYVCFFEYGWCNFHNGQHNINPIAQQWRNQFIGKLTQKLVKACRTEKIPFSQVESVLAPPDGSMWIEKKYTMISIASNTKVSEREVHFVVESICSEVFGKNQSFIMNKHHLGIDLLPSNSSKRIAALEAKKILDPNNNMEKWLIFGDSKYDREMCQAFPDKKTEFILTRDGASLDVLKKLESLFDT